MLLGGRVLVCREQRVYSIPHLGRSPQRTLDDHLTRNLAERAVVGGPHRARRLEQATCG